MQLGSKTTLDQIRFVCSLILVEWEVGVKAELEVNPSGFQQMKEKVCLFGYRHILVEMMGEEMQPTRSELQYMKRKVPLSGFQNMTTEQAGLFEYQHILVVVMEEELEAVQFAFRQRLVVGGLLLVFEGVMEVSRFGSPQQQRV